MGPGVVPALTTFTERALAKRLRKNSVARLGRMEVRAMDYKLRFVIALGGVAALFVAGCAVEVPKSTLPDFRLSKPETTNSS
jgi:hypothetical protein